MSHEKAVSRFIASVAKANKEEAVLACYRHLIGADAEWDRPFSTDGLFEGTLFEFKHQVSLQGHGLSAVLAQLCAYLRLFYTKGVYKKVVYPLPLRVAACSEKDIVCVPIKTLAPFFMNDAFDWTRPANNPDPKLIAALHSVESPVYSTRDASQVEVFLGALKVSGDQVKQLVTRQNFVSIFETWRAQFAPKLNQQDAALAYLYDLQNLRYVNTDAGSVLLGPPGKGIELRVPTERYLAFWQVFRIPPSNKELAAILARKDQLVAMQLRRETGEFFTPLDIAALAHQKLLEVVPDAYENYLWWDPCCGLGNLTLACPEMPGRLFLSTLNKQDVEAVKQSGESPEALVFDHDFLNYPDEDLPKPLRDKLTPGSKWIFFLNPPFAAGTDLASSFGDGEKPKTGVSDTQVGTDMEAERLGHACQNTYAQFMHRIQLLVRAYQLDATVCLFSKALFTTGTSYQDFRSSWFSTFTSVGAFTFPSSEFAGAKGAWPVLFSMWKSGASASGQPVEVEAEVYERDTTGELVRTGLKVFSPSSTPLTKSVLRPNGDVVAPPMTSALAVKTEGNVRLDRWATGSVAYLSSRGNDVQNSGGFTALLSGPYSNGHGWSVLPVNFETSLVCFAARKLVKATWLNDRDEFSVPDTSHPKYAQFVQDAVVWGLFHGSNQTSSLGNVEYKGQTYDIPNHFFWLDPEEVADYDGLPAPLYRQCQKAAKRPRFVATWLRTQGKTFSPDAQKVLDLAADLVKFSASKRPHAEPRFQLDRWDAGWYQIRNGLYGKDVPFTKTPEMIAAWESFQVAYRELTERLRPMIYALGILPKEEGLSTGAR
jgi:hypothetical protein